MSEINEPQIPPVNDNSAGNKNTTQPKGRGRKKFVVIGAFLVLFIIAGAIGVGVAKNKVDKFREHGPFGFMMERIVKDLDLTAQQKTEVDKIREEVKAKMEEKKNSRKEQMDGYEQMFRSDYFDKQKALDLAKQHDAERDEMRSFFIEETAKFHAILTPDQRNKAADKMKEMREHKGKHGEDKDGRKPPRTKE